MKIEIRKLGNDLHHRRFTRLRHEDRVTARSCVIGKKDTYRARHDGSRRRCPEMGGADRRIWPRLQHPVILEKDGQLYTQIEWVLPLSAQGNLRERLQVPRLRPVHGDKITFMRDKAGIATHVDAASMCCSSVGRLPKPGETFKIEPVRPLDELRKIALAATPPRGEERVFQEAGPGRSDVARQDDQARHPLCDQEQLPGHAVLHVGQGVHASPPPRRWFERSGPPGQGGLWPADPRRLSPLARDQDVPRRDAGEICTTSSPTRCKARATIAAVPSI